MKVLLRNQKTRLYVAREEAWTTDRNAARDFTQSLAALHHVSAMRLQDMEAVLTFGEPRYDLSLPLGPLLQARASLGGGALL